jgi:predicted LPLAT superfamily acyltransferase
MIGAMARAHRAHERRRVSWDATLHQDGRMMNCKVVDLSDGGAKIRIDQRLASNSWVALVVERLGIFPGEVRWQDERFAGICFMQDPAIVEARLRSVPLGAAYRARSEEPSEPQGLG